VKSNGRGNGNGKYFSGKPPSVRCAVYVRKSIERGLEQEFNSLDAQRESCAAYIAAHRSNGWVALADDYSDGGFSGSNVDRPAWQRLMTDVESGHVDIIVVYRVDRLTRSIRDFIQLIDFLETHGASFASVTESFDTTTPSGRAFLTMLMTFAQLERETIAERTRDKIAAARRKGKWTGGIPVLGYDVTPDRGKIVVNEAEAKRVRVIFELYLEMGSLKETLREMNRLGITRKRWRKRDGVETGGKPFNKSGLHMLLTNPIFVGRVKLDDETHEGEHATIVDTAVWDEVQRRLQANGFKKAAAFRNEHGAFLKGLLHCSVCNARMTHSVSRKGDKVYRYYVCSRAQREGWSSCLVKSVTAGKMEAAVLDEIRAVIQDHRIERDVWGEVVKLRRERIRQLEREIEITGESADPKILQRLRDELGALNEAQIDRDDVATAVSDFTPLWDALTYQEQEQLAMLLIEKIDYDGEEIEIRFREPAHVG